MKFCKIYIVFKKMSLKIRDLRLYKTPTREIFLYF